MIFSSCDEDSFSQVATIELPEHEPRPVVNLEIEGLQERRISALISNSKGILDPETTYDLPVDAEVKLYRNGTLFTPLDYFEDVLKYEASLENPFPDQGGDTYLLEANIPGFDLVQVEQVMPVKPVIEAATYEREGTIDESGFRVDELIVDITDQEPGVLNYYGLELFQITLVIEPTTGDTIQYSRSRIGIDSNDPLLSYGARYDLIFSDGGFSGGKYQARCYTYYSLDENADLEVRLYQLSEDAFLYARSLEQYYNAINNPFAEPVTVHSNVPDGYGVFTLANRTSYFIER
jgi:hypothetical protein